MSGSPALGYSSVDSAVNGVAVTKSDTTVIGPTRRLWVGGAGNVAVVFFGDNTATAVTYANVPAGTYLQVNVSKVMSTNTTATSIVAELF